MIVSLVVFIFICESISSSKVWTLSVPCCNMSDHVPQILYPCNNTVEALVGSKLEITCRVWAELHPTVEILVYWLANQSYIEDYSKSTRVTEVRTFKCCIRFCGCSFCADQHHSSEHLRVQICKIQASTQLCDPKINGKYRDANLEEVLPFSLTGFPFVTFTLFIFIAFWLPHNI
ncbi:uncharacterized protein LOC144682834 isoform X2 [Cetorhinus maximus]